MRSTTNLHRKLVKVDRGPLGAAGSWGIPHRISGDPSPRLYTSGGTGILRYAVLDLRRDSGTLAQRGYRGNPTGSTKLHIPNFPSREKRWGLPSCYKPQEVEPLCQDRTLQDGGFTPSSISDPAGGLDGEAGFERCLLTGANPPRSASSPPVSMAKEILPSCLSVGLGPQKVDKLVGLVALGHEWSGSNRGIMVSCGISTPHKLSGRDETILQYIDILQYFLQQYNTIWLKGNINILHTAIYCDILQYIAMFVVLKL